MKLEIPRHYVFFKIFMLILLCIGITNSRASNPKTYLVKSPNKQVNLKITIDRNIQYEVSYKNTIILLPSAISMTLGNGKILGADPKISSHNKLLVSEIVSPLYGKFKYLQNQYTQLKIDFKNNYSVIFRVFDEGVAYRFVTKREGEINVVNEISNYNFPSDLKTYLPVAKSFVAHYEEHYQHCNLSELTDGTMGFSPLILEYPGNIKVALTESALMDYPGMYLEKQTAGGKPILSGKWPGYPLEVVKNKVSYDIKKRADYIAITSGSRSFPWRMLLITDDERKLLTSELVYLLAEPCSLKDVSWIKPGKVAWDWWYAKNLSGVDFKTGMNTETYKYYIDFAANNQLEYIIIDGGWSDRIDLTKVNPQLDIPYLTKYGKDKNVGVILWVANNAFDRDIEKNLDLFKSWGVAGLKIDYVERDDQLGVRFFADIANAAAKRQMVIDFHGCSKPAGIQRTYPNILNFEAVLGAEYSKWSDRSNPDYNVMIPFLRMLSGPMDFTPGALRNASKENFRVVRNEPMSQGTRCHQLAMYITYDSPLVMLSDAPTAYEKEPVILKLLANLKTTWDTTVVLDAKLCEYMVTAKKSNDTWYIGALNNWTEREVTIDFSFLPEGSYTADLFTDGINANKVATDYKNQKISIDRNSKLKIVLAEGGGAVFRITNGIIKN